jgi:hypothetical protein
VIDFVGSAVCGGSVGVMIVSLDDTVGAIDSIPGDIDGLDEIVVLIPTTVSGL